MIIESNVVFFAAMICIGGVRNLSSIVRFQSQFQMFHNADIEAPGFLGGLQNVNIDP